MTKEEIGIDVVEVFRVFFGEASTLTGGRYSGGPTTTGNYSISENTMSSRKKKILIIHHCTV